MLRIVDSKAGEVLRTTAATAPTSSKTARPELPAAPNIAPFHLIPGSAVPNRRMLAAEIAIWFGRMAMETAAALFGASYFPVSAAKVAKAREKRDPAAIATVLHTLAVDRSNVVSRTDATRLDRTRQLLAGLDANGIDRVRQAYIAQYGCDPETNIRSWDLGEPLVRLDDNLALEMVSVLNGPRLTEAVSTIRGLLAKDQLTREDRATYFSLLPMLGLWDSPRRTTPEKPNLDSMERKIIQRIWQTADETSGVSFDQALKAIEAKLPAADLAPKAARNRSIAAVASSSGAQWQELMDWATVMNKLGYHVQLFTAEGRPIAFQHDSMSVCARTAPLGHGCPPHLDPRGETGDLARKLLANTAKASDFNPDDFGAVYWAGGLGFNEDIAVAHVDQNGKIALEANKNIEGMMAKVVDARLPNIALCHGPTIFAVTKMKVNGRMEPIAKGLKTASLPPLEGFVGLTRRKEPEFTVDVNTQGALSEAGAHTSTLLDIANMARVVWSGKAGLRVITGPAPQAATNLGYATDKAIIERWG